MARPSAIGEKDCASVPAAPGPGLDRDALFDELLRRHGPALRRVAAAYERDPARREDLFQDVCLALWRALPAFRGDASARTYVFRIAHNRGLTHRARRRDVPTAELEEAEAVADPAPGPEAGLHHDQRRERLRRAIRALPLPQRQVLTLALEGLPHREIGEVLGITENHVAVRLSRARAALRRRLAPAGGSAP